MPARRRPLSYIETLSAALQDSGDVARHIPPLILPALSAVSVTALAHPCGSPISPVEVMCPIFDRLKRERPHVNTQAGLVEAAAASAGPASKLKKGRCFFSRTLRSRSDLIDLLEAQDTPTVAVLGALVAWIEAKRKRGQSNVAIGEKIGELEMQFNHRTDLHPVFEAARTRTGLPQSFTLPGAWGFTAPSSAVRTHRVTFPVVKHQPVSPMTMTSDSSSSTTSLATIKTAGIGKMPILRVPSARVRRASSTNRTQGEYVPIAIAAGGLYMLPERSAPRSPSALRRIRSLETRRHIVEDGSGYASDSPFNSLRKRWRPTLPPTTKPRGMTQRPDTPSVTIQRTASVDYAWPTDLSTLPARPSTSLSTRTVRGEPLDQPSSPTEYFDQFAEKNADQLLEARLDSLIETGAAQTFLRLFKAPQ